MSIRFIIIIIVGYEEGGVLTEAVRRKPYAVILLDEYEKSNREVSNILLHEGTLSDSHGRVIDFKNTVIIMTSNIGIEELYKGNEGGVATINSIMEQRGESKEMLGRHFPPEFISRIDEVIPFARLSTDHIRVICKIQLKKVISLLRDKNITIEISDDAENWLSLAGYDPIYGARSPERLIQSKLPNPLATYILEKKIPENSSVICSVGDVTRDGYLRLGLSSHDENSELRFFIKS